MEPTDRLESWKEIAAYLGRDTRTAQRWEASEDLPVHRHQHKKRGSVFALRSEIDQWRASRAAEFFSGPDPPANEEQLPQRRRLRSRLLAGGSSLLLVTVALFTLPGAIEPAKPTPVPTWDAPRLLGEITREDGAIDRIPIGPGVESLAIAPDGKTLFASICGDDGAATVWEINLQSRKGLRLIAGLRGCLPILLSATGDRLMTADNSEVVIVDTATRGVRRVPTPATAFRDLALAHNDRTLFAAALFHGLLEIDLPSGRVLTRNALPCPVSLALSPNTDHLFVGYQCSGPGGRRGHDAIDVLDTSTGGSLGPIINLPNVGGDLAVSPDGSSLWADGADACRSDYYDTVGCPPGVGSIVNVISAPNRTLLRSLRVGGREEFNTRLSFTRDGSRVVSGRAEINVVSTTSLNVVEALSEPLRSNLVFAPDGRTAYAAMGDGQSISVLPIEPHPAPPPGLTARWTADGVYTDSAGGNDIMAERRGPFEPGRIGQAFSVRGDTPLRLSKPSLLGSASQMSAMAWVKIEVAGTVMEYAAMDPAGQFGWQLLTQGDGRPALCIGGYERGRCQGSRSLTLVGTASLAPGRWHHLAFTRLNETTVLFLDGREVARAEGVKGGFPLSEILFLRFGSDEAGLEAFRGGLDEVEIYNRPLSPEEVLERGK